MKSIIRKHYKRLRFKIRTSIAEFSKLEHYNHIIENDPELDVLTKHRLKSRLKRKRFCRLVRTLGLNTFLRVVCAGEILQGMLAITIPFLNSSSQVFVAAYLASSFIIFPPMAFVRYYQIFHLGKKEWQQSEYSFRKLGSSMLLNKNKPDEKNRYTDFIKRYTVATGVASVKMVGPFYPVILMDQELGNYIIRNHIRTTKSNIKNKLSRRRN